MTTDSRGVAARDRAFDLLATLALADVATECGFLLGGAILAVSDRYRRSISDPGSRGHRLARLLSFSEGSLQTVAVVLTAVGDGECLTLELLLTNLVSWIANELGSGRRFLEGLFSRDFLVFAETQH